MTEEVKDDAIARQRRVKECEELAQKLLDILNAEQISPFMAVASLNTALTSIALQQGVTQEDYDQEMDRLKTIYKGLYDERAQESPTDDGAKP